MSGKYLVSFADNATEAGSKLLWDAGGLNVLSTRTMKTSEVNPNVESNQALVFHNLGVAVVNAEQAQLEAVKATSLKGESNPILTIEPERILFAAQEETTSASTVDEPPATWGLIATKVLDSQYTGRGVKVAILDTGLDLNHPDFTGRTIVSQSFVQSEDVQDGYGHGTLSTGTACGPRKPSQLPRYGVAYESDIYIGKVLENQDAKGNDGVILQGIQWALENGCQIISMSISGSVIVGQPFSQLYETLARRVLEQGSIIIAAAGNNSERNAATGAIYKPTGYPANCPSIMAVAAVDSQLEIGWFSNRALNSSDGSGIDIAGPGVDVYSSRPMPTKYGKTSGTSIAVSHVSGIAALFAEAKPEARGKALWDLLTQTTRALEFSAIDVGAGLVQAP